MGLRGGNLAGQNLGDGAMKQRIHESAGLADVARILKQCVDVLQRGLGVTEEPSCPCSIGQCRPPDVLAEAGRQRTMLLRHVEGDGAIEMRLRRLELTQHQQAGAHQPMADEQRNRCIHLLGTRQELLGQGQQNVEVDADVVRGPRAVHDREPQQRVLRLLAERLCPIDHRAGLLESGDHLGR